MNNSIYLPSLKHIRIVNYSLYNQDIDYEFIEGLNLIIGGNGVGKTTFISIVKYALIGLYKKDLDVRIYKGEKKLIRGKYINGNTFFRNRTQGKESDKEGYVELYFNINSTAFYVKRSLYNIQILQAYYIKNGNRYDIQGKSIRQDLYKDYEGDTSHIIDNLQYNYEKIVAQEANLADFDDFIFFINQILLFGESRENVLWSEDVQERLLSNFLNDAILEKRRKKYSLEAKYQDSIARHKQEEIKAITRVLEQLRPQKTDAVYAESKKMEILKQIENTKSCIEQIQNSRQELQNRTEANYKDISKLSMRINELEKEKEKIEDDFNKQYWPGINPKYNIYKKQYLSNQICPMCNSELKNLPLRNELRKCFFCNTEIEIEYKESRDIDKINRDLHKAVAERSALEAIVDSNEKEIKHLDSEFRDLRVKLFKDESIVRSLERPSKDSESQNESSYLAMITRIEELTQDKEKAVSESLHYEAECIKIMNCIEENMLENTKSISNIFSDFAGDFMKLPCYLTLEKIKDKKIKLFFPVIDNKTRFDSEELSESQRFFVDYSFRMSILTFFYECPSFYICETPDSSLDISYEENAADIFVKYLEKPNSLILTSNLNNSTFIKNILSKTAKRKVLNLLKFGKISSVQKNHAMLNALSNEIEEMCNE